MTREQLLSLIARKQETYPVPKLPPANPDDFYVFQGEAELAAVLAEMDLLDGSDTSMAAQLDDAGFGSQGIM